MLYKNGSFIHSNILIMKANTKKFVLTAKGTVNKTISNALRGCRFDATTNKIYTKRYSGSGRYINLQDYSFYVSQILNLQGYKFETGNDAPRGGKEGDFFKVSKTAFNFLKKLL